MKSAYLNTSQSFRACALAASIACAALLMPASFAAGGPSAPTIEITKFAFGPKEITVRPGTKIVWANRDETPHTVASNDKSFASKGLDTNDKFEHAFSTEGDFAYYCTLHPFMTGVVHVRKQ
ncbi:MAG TPA: cupredoxin family copper-binding protein [Burkholderiales bacterium]